MKIDRALCSWNVFIFFCCLLLLFSACSPGSENVSSSSTATISARPTPTQGRPTPTSAPLTDSQLASAIVRRMSLDQKLGQMVIVEFYGATFNGDLKEMIRSNQVGG